MIHYVVVDTNVIVSALCGSYGKERGSRLSCHRKSETFSDRAVHCNSTTDAGYFRWQKVITAPYTPGQM